jgi:uncharacterized protein YjiS (DUF1127 family)
MTMIDTNLPAGFGRTPRSLLSHNTATALREAFTATVTALLDGLERARQRRQLLGLSDVALQDFGASRADAAGEGDKPFWRS